MLGWLPNLDFAGGSAPAAAAGGAEGVYHAESRRSRYRYDYGYRYIKSWNLLTSLFR